MSSSKLQRWHEAVFTREPELLSDLLDDEVVFHSPTVWKPKPGKVVTHFILSNVVEVFEGLEYHREWVNGNEMALEFSAKVNGLAVKGVDLLKWNDAGKIVEMEVCVRPLNGLQALFDEMGERVVKAGLA